MTQKIQFYTDSERIQYTDDDDLPDGITFDGVDPIDTTELIQYLDHYENEFSRLDALRHSINDEIANEARGSINKLNRERQGKLDDFCKKIQRSK